MFLGKLNRLAVVGLLGLMSAGPQATPQRSTSPAAAKPATAAASSEDLAVHPEILTQDFNPLTVSIYGIKVGEKTDKVPKEKMDRLAAAYPGIMKLQGGYQLRYNPTTLTVTALMMNGRETLVKTGLLDRYDVEFRFGKADIADDRHMIYLNRRLLFIFNSQDITSIEIR
jgi:hypothetical protein